jgi:hypothetical protein
VALIARAAGEAGEIVAAPAIRASSKTFALGASIVVGTAAGLLTAGIAHGSVALYGIGLSAYERYKDPFVAAITDAANVASETVMKKIQPIELAAPLPKIQSEPALVHISKENTTDNDYTLVAE